MARGRARRADAMSSIFANSDIGASSGSVPRRARRRSPRRSLTAPSIRTYSLKSIHPIDQRILLSAEMPPRAIRIQRVRSRGGRVPAGGYGRMSSALERLFDPGFDLADHQLHRAHRRLVRRVADLEREAHMHGLGRADLGYEVFGDRLDLAG